VDLSRRNQTTANFSGGLGEPKFNVDGSAFNEPWGRPQNDGPALRAATLMLFADLLLRQGKKAYVIEKLYDGQIPSHTVIKSDLEYVAHHWRETSFDLWEEVKGMHFYTLLAQRKAMVWGARLAQNLGDGGAARFYTEQASLMNQVIMDFFDGKRRSFSFIATMFQDGGLLGKNSGLDSAIILGVLHGYADDGFLAPSSDLILSSAHQIRLAFHSLYGINRNTSVGTAIGRYPEDVYNGNGTSPNGGNPWFLSTLAYAELYLRVRAEFLNAGLIRVSELNLAFMKTVAPQMNFQPGSTYSSGTKEFAAIIEGLRAHADLFFARVLMHQGVGGHLAEQFNRDSGYMQGAPDLTWSYAAFTSAYMWRRLTTAN
jgi:glucoamylase